MKLLGYLAVIAGGVALYLAVTGKSLKEVFRFNG